MEKASVDRGRHLYLDAAGLGLGTDSESDLGSL
jgi:hypothetical protein